MINKTIRILNSVRGRNNDWRAGSIDKYLVNQIKRLEGARDKLKEGETK